MRSTIQKQNSPPRRTSLITRYCLATVVLLELLGPLAGESRGDFILRDDEQLIVSSHHNQGVLFDRSRVSIVSGGSVTDLYAYNSSTVGISAGSVTYIYAWDSSAVNMSGGSVGALIANDSSAVAISGISSPLQSVGILNANDSSAVAISGGAVKELNASNYSTVDISGGSVGFDSSRVSLRTNNSSRVGISGGSVAFLVASDSSAVAISGGSITTLKAMPSSAVTFYGQNFRVAGGLAFDGERVLGTGTLSGEWIDGTRWVVNITYSNLTATILAIPESAHKPFCVKYHAMDFTGDCKVDFSDLAVFLTHWLDCNLEPPEACWE